MNYQSVLFVDLDGTILKSPFDMVFPTVFGELAQQSNLQPEIVQHHVVKESQRRQQDSTIPLANRLDWDDIITTVARQIGVEVSEQRVLETLEVYLKPPHTQILDQADTVLPQLSTDQRAVVAVTKGLAKYQQRILDSLNLTSFFADLITVESNQASKDSRAFYGDWVDQARLKLIVGDQYQDDVVYPHEFGFKPIWKPTGSSAIEDPLERAASFDPPDGQTVRPEAIIFSLQELPNVVEKLERRFLGHRA